MTNNLIYVYCLSDNPPEFDRISKPEGLKCLNFDRFFITAKKVSEKEFDEANLKKNLSDIPWLESNAREHIRVISMIMEQVTVIPFKFGTIYYSEDSLRKFTEDYSAILNENLHDIEGKEEWTVKIYSDRRVLSERIGNLSTAASDIEEQIRISSPGKAFILRRKKADLIESEMNRICKGHGQAYYDEFKNLSESTIINNLLPKELTGREDTMILNATFFVNKNKAADFKNTVNTLQKKNEDYGFIIEATGPWPSFSFISIKEKYKCKIM